MKFWDASALVPLVVEQKASPGLREELRKDPEVIVWWGTRLECISALMRLVREGRLASERATRCAQDLRQLLLDCLEVQPLDAIRVRAERLLGLHAIKAADALQLAAALAWCQEKTTGNFFVCLDTQLRESAAREGFHLAPPGSGLAPE